MFDFLPPWLNPVSFVLLVIVLIMLLAVALLYFRNPTATKLGVRNMPRRPTQTALIVAGLTLSTVIIVAALSTGDTLDYSVQRYAVSAYGGIDEAVARAAAASPRWPASSVKVTAMPTPLQMLPPPRASISAAPALPTR
ncbi:MAG: hypothetical protein R2873_33425 [Caldilineaceae bacterium]